MVKKITFYGAGLIALYLVVVNYTGFSKDVSSSTSGASSVVSALQGR